MYPTYRRHRKHKMAFQPVRVAEILVTRYGTTLMEYNSEVKDTMGLAEVVTKAKLPEYSLDSFSVIYNTYVLSLDKMSDVMKDWVSIALQYGPVRSNYASYNGDIEMIRRRISTFIGKDIPKRYEEFMPKAMDKEGVILAHWGLKYLHKSKNEHYHRDSTI